jgi:hypothetical protein
MRWGAVMRRDGTALPVLVLALALALAACLGNGSKRPTRGGKQ